MIEERLFHIYGNYEMRDYWKDIYIKMKDKKINTWDYQWSLSIIANNCICINPNVNLISNIGFDDNATHTSNENHPLANTETHPLIDIKHPVSIERSMFIDEVYNEICV